MRERDGETDVEWYTTHKEGNEAEVGAYGDPKRRERVLDESERQVDDGNGEGEDSDDPVVVSKSVAALAHRRSAQSSPEVDGEVGKTVEALDVACMPLGSVLQLSRRRETLTNGFP